jgi:hypothetical protein
MIESQIRKHILAAKNKDLSYFGINRSSSKKDIIRYAESKIISGINKNNKELITKYFTLGIYTNEAMLLRCIHKGQLFRASQYNFNTPTAILNSIKAINEHLDAFDISERTKTYLKSTELLLGLSYAVLCQYSKIIQFIDINKDKFVKTIIVAIEIMFTTDYEFDHNQPTSDIRHYSKEQLSEAASFLIFTHRKKHGHIHKSINFIEDNLDVISQYIEILIMACVVKKYYYMEIQIEKLPYQIRLQENIPTLQAIDDEFEKHLRFGYLFNGLKEAELADTKDKDNALAMHSFLDKSKVLHGKCIVLEEEPLPRYVFKAPSTYRKLIHAFLDRDKFFFEEKCLIKQICRDYYVDESTFSKFTLRNNVTITDLILFRRIIFLLAHPFCSFIQEKLKSGTVEEKITVMRSIVPVFEIKKLVSLISEFLDEKIVVNIIDMLSYPGKNKIFDFQYTPFVKFNEHILLPVNTFIRSNTIRNSLFNENKRFFEDNQNEPLVNATLSCLKKCMDYASANIKFLDEKFSGEIDVLGIKDNNLFIFEVKNSLLPCNPAELRTSFDHIQHGVNQLCQVKELITNNDDFYAKFMRRISSFSRNNVYLCIIFGNRLFSGYRYRGIPIYSVYSILNFLTTGKAFIGDKVESMWSGPSICSADIIDFLHSSTRHSINIQHMQEYYRTYKIADKEFCIKSFLYNAQAAKEYYDVKYPEDHLPTR